MQRMTMWTGLGLTLLYVSLSILFAESLPVQVRDCRLTDREAVMTIENEGGEPLRKVHVVARVYAGDRLVTASALVEKRDLAGKARVQVKLPLAKPLARGSEYRVVAFVQMGSGRPRSREFTPRTVEQAAVWAPARRSRTIDEPGKLRRCITPIDPRAEMGLL
ncbi:MAG: hypothetical protein GX442_05010 [Candidatus Riflebacteria bacterium]|nr:hypothetical protein [Candidatus Riflebacteria bacterium]